MTQIEKLRTPVNSAQLFMLTGQKFDVNRVLEKANENHKYKKSEKVQLKHIIDSGLMPKSKSIDARFDGNDQIISAIESLETNGLPKSMFLKMTTHSGSIKKNKIMGPLSFIAKLLTEEEVHRVKERIKAANKYWKQYGEMP